MLNLIENSNDYIQKSLKIKEIKNLKREKELNKKVIYEN